MITVNDVLENMKKFVGVKDWTADDIICAFEDLEEDGETSVIFNKSQNYGYDYIAYIDSENSTQFLITVDENKIITDVRIG